MDNSGVTPLLSVSEEHEDYSEMQILPRYWRPICCGLNRPNPSKRLMFAILLCAFGLSVPFGFSLTVINIPERIFEQFINDSNYAERGKYLDEAGLKALWSFVVSSFTLGGALGGLAGSVLSDKMGRKLAIVAAAGIAILASTCTSLSYPSDSLEVFTVGRAIMGFSSGLGSCLLSIYLSEISPVVLRGFSGAFQEIFIVFGKLLGLIVSLPALLGSETQWPWMVSLPSFIAITVIIILPFLPETPKYLRQKNPENSDKCIKSVRFYHGSQASSGQVIEQIDRELTLVESQLSLSEVLKHPIFRRCLLLASLIRLAQELTGVTAIANFSTEIFQSIGLSDQQAIYNTLGIGFVGLVVTSCAVFMVEYVGRRPLLVYGLLGTLICDIVFMCFALVVEHDSTQSWAGYGCIVVFYLHTVLFSSGPGPVGWLIVPEIVPQAARATVTSVGVFVNWTANLLVTAAFLPLKTAIGNLSFLLFIVPLALLTVYLFVKLPETRNKPVDQIVIELMGERPNAQIIDYESFHDRDSNC